MEMAAKRSSILIEQKHNKSTGGHTRAAPSTLLRTPSAAEVSCLCFSVSFKFWSPLRQRKQQDQPALSNRASASMPILKSKKIVPLPVTPSLSAAQPKSPLTPSRGQAVSQGPRSASSAPSRSPGTGYSELSVQQQVALPGHQSSDDERANKSSGGTANHSSGAKPNLSKPSRRARRGSGGRHPSWRRGIWNKIKPTPLVPNPG